ncbi:hypothetical protein KK083_14410 [Fulvivirgaceae bacterium PWU4]|uniref:Uncharacterized protein n=1 Tax=Chryseosolibacter histidini TaxID=2782349 RepID=A0AAP2DNF4_9BACT|nr:hypothetical protein [Chryseosolibacter histidini]MBT1698082.1 hypothetical protein [Chryseosolibacter histidini]
MNKVENEVYDDEEEATHEEMRGVVWTVVSIVVVFGILVSLTVIIVL